MTIVSTIIAAVSIFAVSTAFSMVGVGGGVLYVPILLTLGMNFHDAATTSLFVILGNSISAFIIYFRHGFVDWKLASVIEPPTFIMAFVGGMVSNHISGSALKIVFAAILMLASFFMIRPATEEKNIQVQRWGYWRRTLGENSYVVRLPGLIPATALAGFIAGMIGISGGVLKMPAMVLLGHVPMRIAVGTSSLMLAATAIAGLSGHIIGGSFNVLIALPLAAAAFIGGRLGSTLSVRVNAVMLRRFFAILLFLVSIWLIVDEVTGYV